MKRTIRNSAMFTAVCFCAVLVVGCSSDPLATDFKSINGNLTPELMTTSQRPVDVRRAMAYSNDANSRMFWDDMGRAFYTDHPSILSPYPIVNVAGTPR